MVSILVRSGGLSSTNDLPVRCSQVDQKNLLAVDRILWAFAVEFHTLHTSHVPIYIDQPCIACGWHCLTLDALVAFMGSLMRLTQKCIIMKYNAHRWQAIPCSLHPFYNLRYREQLK